METTEQYNFSKNIDRSEFHAQYTNPLTDKTYVMERFSTYKKNNNKKV